LELIRSGQKTLEVRPSTEVSNISAGEQITLQSSKKSIRVEIVAVRKYESFAEITSTEDLDKIVPGVTKERAANLWKQFYTSNPQSITILELKFLQDVDTRN
jgi:ASC-1-like (ASCH) protein